MSMILRTVIRKLESNLPVRFKWRLLRATHTVKARTPPTPRARARSIPLGLIRVPLPFHHHAWDEGEEERSLNSKARARAFPKRQRRFESVEVKSARVYFNEVKAG